MKKEMDKNHPRNRLLECYIPKASTYATITKLPHFTHEEIPIGSDDLTPYVIYSLNKKRRWEIPTNTVDENDDDVKTFVFDKEIKGVQAVWWALNGCFHQTPYYYSRAIDTNLMDLAKKEEKVMGYHVFRAPQNFKKVFENKCSRYMGLRYPDFLGYTTRELLTPLEFELKENEGEDCFDEKLSENMAVVEGDSGNTPPAFYNLEDHIVFKKPRKPKVHGWTVV